MKTNKITLLSIMSITAVLPVVAMTTLSCNQNTANSSTDNIAPIEPILPGGDETTKPNPEPEKPSKPEEPSKPVDPTPDKPIIDNQTLNPTVSKVEVVELNDKFEVVITGTNLSQNVADYLFRLNALDSGLVAQSMKEGSSSEQVTLIVSNADFQNKDLFLSVMFGDAGQYSFEFKNVIKFGYFSASVEQFKNYINDFNIMLQKAVEYSQNANTYYLTIYDWVDTVLSVTTNTGIRVTGTKVVQTYPTKSNKDIKGSVSFTTQFVIKSNSEEKTLSFKFWNPDPKGIDMTNLSFAAKTTDGLLFIKDTIVGYAGTSKNVKIDRVLEGKDINGQTIKSLTIKTIANDAFSGKGIESVSFDSTIVTIGDRAFANNNLTSVVFPKYLNKIGESSFSNNKLTNVDFQLTLLREIPASAFANNLIQNFVLNNLIHTIGIRAFEGNKLTTATINSIFKNNLYLSTIERWAFANNSITLNVAGYTPHNIIYLPKNLEAIGVGAFEVNEKINFGFGSIDSAVTYFTKLGLQEPWVSFNVKVINEEGVRYFIKSYDLFNVRVVNQKYYDLGWDWGESSNFYNN